ncbi:MAG: hypothetical protein IKB42_03595 [Clostridia bacterium]|nr:hypothetical protein [Clostridia bacterium]
MEFCDLYSKSELKNIVNNDIDKNMLNHAYLLCGQDEIYLSYLAKEFAKNILCVSSGCGVCPACIKIEKGVHSDVLVYPKDSSKGLVVDDINEIVENSYIYPLEGDKKIFILNNFDLSTSQAQNKLLKTLEEPPKTCLFILTTTNPSNILNTIKSRSKSLSIPLLGSDDVQTFILKNSSFKPKEVQPFVSSSQGNLTKAVKIINDDNFLKIKDLALNTVLKLTESGEILRYSSQILGFKDRIKEIFDELSLVFLDVMYAKTGLEDKVVNQSKLAEYKNSKYSVKALKIIYSKVLEAQNKLDCNCNPTTVVDGFLITMLEVKHKWK